MGSFGHWTKSSEIIHVKLCRKRVAKKFEILEGKRQKLWQILQIIYPADQDLEKTVKNYFKMRTKEHEALLLHSLSPIKAWLALILDLVLNSSLKKFQS